MPPSKSTKAIHRKIWSIWKPMRPTNWVAHHHCKWEHSTQPIFAAKPTCWRTVELPKPLNSKSFQKLLDHKVIVLTSVTGSLVHLQIGRAYAMGGDTAKAKSAYQDFLTLWKDPDPDPDIPIPKKRKRSTRSCNNRPGSK
jgi:hypothetical protein